MTIHTYFFLAKGTNRVKIGRATDPERRLAELQGGCPVPLVRLAIWPGDHEQELHRYFKFERLHGEWFTASFELRRWVNLYWPKARFKTEIPVDFVGGQVTGFRMPVYPLPPRPVRTLRRLLCPTTPNPADVQALADKPADSSEGAGRGSGRTGGGA